MFPAFDELSDCIYMSKLMLQEVTPRKNITLDPKYKYMFSVEKVNELVLNGIPFRDAYRLVAQEIEQEVFTAHDIINHTHEGSIGNLCNKQVKDRFESYLSKFNFKQKHEAIKKLVTS
jgi:argininosuccinate lyase